MADAKITIEQLAESMQKELPATFDIYNAHRDEAKEQNSAMLRSEWQRVVDGEGFMTPDEE